MSDELLSCPFCGKPGRVDVHNLVSGVLHEPLCIDDDCVCNTLYDTYEEAIAAWNRRTIPTPQPLDAQLAAQGEWEPVTFLEIDHDDPMHVKDGIALYKDWDSSEWFALFPEGIMVMQRRTQPGGEGDNES